MRRFLLALPTLALLTLAGCASTGAHATSETTPAPTATTPAPPPTATTAPPSGELAAAYGTPIDVDPGDDLTGTAFLRVLVSQPSHPASMLGGFSHPAAGPAYTEWTVELTNIGKAPGSYNASDFLVRRPDHTEALPTFLGEQSLSAATLNPGETVRGTVTFDAGPHGVLVYRPLAGRALAHWPAY